MILVDTSVWIDHFREGEPELIDLLKAGRVIQHPYVTGELAMGSLADWPRTIAGLCALPQISMADTDSLLSFVAVHQLAGTGIGFVDAHILASSLGTTVSLWTLDARLLKQAKRLGIRCKN